MRLVMEISGLFRHVTLRGILKATVIGFIGVILTLVSAYYVKTGVDRSATKEFQAICTDISTRIKVRMVAQAQLLRSGAAFFAVSDTVGRREWRIFYEKSSININLPGIEGYGFSLIIPKNQLKQHIEKVRKEGFPAYKVRPEKDRDVYTSILYIEPFEGRNLRAFGFDMFSEPVRRKAMETARDSNMATISGRVKLVQETGNNPQPGTLMFVPVYRNGLTIGTVEERRAAIRGWVYSPYRMHDLMDGIFGKWEKKSLGIIHLQIYDGDNPTKDNLLYDSQAGMEVLADTEVYTLPVVLNGRMWSLVFSHSNPDRLLIYSKVYYILISGMLISIMLFVLALSLFSTQRRAEIIARKLTAEIETTTKRLSLAVRAGGVGIWDWDIVSNQLVWDDQMYSLYGITADRFKGAYQSWLDGLHPEDKERGNQEIQASLRGEKNFDTEFRVCWPDGTVHILRGNAIIQRDKEGTPLHMIGTNWDITGQKKREEDLISAKIEADLASHSKSEFLSRMSHELRTPLNVVLGFAQLLEKGQLTEPQKRAVGQILTGGRKLLEMINNVLDISSMDAGKLEVNIEPVNISEILTSVLEELKPMASEKKLTVHLSDSILTSAPVKADRTKFRQVLYNLLSNAVKFNRDDGTIRIEASRITRKETDDFVRISVTDTGIGIRTENLKHLFQPFERVEPDHIDYTGRGLGLAVLRKMVLAMNGTYGVASTYGEGSTFWIELPGA